MATQVTNYQCPACTGPVQFSSQSGKLACDYCGATYEVAEIEALYAQKNEKAEQAFAQQAAANGQGGAVTSNAQNPSTDWGEDAQHMQAYSCPSCAAELICDDTTAATSCPYCGNPTIVPGQFGGALKPDYVIPFKFDKEAAKAALQNHYKGKPLLPKEFKTGNHVEEIRGVYVPFWMFDGKTNIDVLFKATKSKVVNTPNEEITTTDHYEVRRAGMVPFQKIPVDASTKMPDAHMEAIEPFDYQDLKPFSVAYLPGFLADKFDVSADECAVRVNERAEATALDKMQATVQGYDSCRVDRKQVEVAKEQAQYCLAPVWLLATKWKGESYLFAMNGQTGKMVGNLPISWGKFFAFFFGISIPLSFIGGIIGLITLFF